MRRAVAYRNILVEIERGRRAAIRAHYSSVGDMVDLELRAKQAREISRLKNDEVKRYKAKHRTRKIPPAMRKDLDEARVASRDAMNALKGFRRSCRTDEFQLELDRINDLSGELCRSSRAHCGVWWGSYQLVEDSMDQVRKMPLYDGLEPNDPRFVRWRGEGAVGVQIQKKLATHDIGQPHTFLQLVHTGPREYFYTLMMRVGSNGRAPIWAEWPLKLHRPLPRGLVKRAYVTKRMIGPRVEWSACFVIDNEPILRDCGRGVIAVNPGWRKVDNGVRVAFAIDDQGNKSECIVDSDLLSSLQYHENLRATRDKNFNEARAFMAQFLRTSECPLWLRDRCKTIASWRSQARLAAVVLRWKDARFEGDEEAYRTIERWRYRDHHLWSWESNQRMKSIRRRRDLYRVWASRMATAYETIIVNDHDMSKTARRPSVDKQQGDNEAARSTRHTVAPSELRESIVTAKRSRKGATVSMGGKVTMVCHECGSEESFDRAVSISHTCENCGATWDQDENACRNMLKRYFESPGDVKVLATARGVKKLDENGKEKESRRQRQARMRGEKQQRNATARKPDANPTDSIGV